MAANAMNATQIMDKAANGFKSAGGLSATYTLIGRNIAKQSGSIKVQGNKFAIQHPMLSTWYDGKTLWNYNADSNEVTISNPTASNGNYYKIPRVVSFIINYNALYFSALRCRLVDYYKNRNFFQLSFIFKST